MEISNLNDKLNDFLRDRYKEDFINMLLGEEKEKEKLLGTVETLDLTGLRMKFDFW